MNEVYNPFEALFKEINALRNDIKELKETRPQIEAVQPQDEFIPIAEFIAKKYVGRTTLYALINDGTLTLYKIGNKSFIKPSEFFAAFTAMSCQNKGGIS